MKHYLTFLTFSLTILMPISIVGQVIADAGPDLKLCINQTNLDSTFLGGNPTAIGGTPPYKYIWYTKIPGSKYIKSASGYLNDTSISNPKLIYLGSVDLHLMVIDGKGDFSYDEVKVKVSSNAMTTDQKVRYITKGQSVELYTLYQGGFPPYKYFWTPNYNISDTNAAKPIVKPDTSLTYYLKIVDSVGCIGPMDNFTIYLYPTSLKELNSESVPFEIFPNPVIDFSTLRLKNQGMKQFKVRITDLLGNEYVLLEPSGFGEFKIHNSDFKKGIYLVQVFDENNIVGHRKIFIN
ncbi:MAG: T9SS type A sorting domain-containing protein [Bacteroidia bacterium]|nr:T9SS type A sorting domain-containing protein [Bacteroidia bacterium]